MYLCSIAYPAYKALVWGCLFHHYVYMDDVCQRHVHHWNVLIVTKQSGSDSYELAEWTRMVVHHVLLMFARKV